MDEPKEMTDESRIRELLEEVLESGRTPDEVCTECPELLPLIRRRLRQIRRVQRGLEALFPPGAPKDAGPPPAPEHDSVSKTDEQTAPARPVRRVEPVVMWLWRHQVTVAVVVLLAAIGGASFWLRHLEKAHQNEKPIRERKAASGR